MEKLEMKFCNSFEDWSNVCIRASLDMNTKAFFHGKIQLQIFEFEFEFVENQFYLLTLMSKRHLQWH